RDKLVTGVQTCALPISELRPRPGDAGAPEAAGAGAPAGRGESRHQVARQVQQEGAPGGALFYSRVWRTVRTVSKMRSICASSTRSEERRVGKESWWRWQ